MDLASCGFMAPPQDVNANPKPTANPNPKAARSRSRGRVVGFALLALAAVLAGLDLAQGRTPDAVDATTTATAPTTATTHPAGPPPPEPSPPYDGPGTFTYAAVGGKSLGTGTDLKRFHVAVEDGLGFEVAPFAGTVDTILGDPRSWIGDGQLALQRVAAADLADFTIYLASAGTSTRMCAEGGLDTEGYTSCRVGEAVVINADRWVGAVPEFDAPLGDYQAYAINHEVGHALGHNHEACPAPGAPAPVMQQQTLGMQGCVPNGWPWVEGALYTGPPIP